VGMYDKRTTGAAAWVIIGMVIFIVLSAIFR
jgi:hypothetical protein